MIACTAIIRSGIGLPACVAAFIYGMRTSRVQASVIHPTIHHNFPQYSFAKFQVSRLRKEWAVRYPKYRLIFLGWCFHIKYPKTIIMTGSIHPHTNIKVELFIDTLFLIGFIIHQNGLKVARTFHFFTFVIFLSFEIDAFIFWLFNGDVKKTIGKKEFLL